MSRAKKRAPHAREHSGLTLTLTTMNLVFSTIDVSRQVFHRTALTFAIVNLKPLVPGRASPSTFNARSKG